MAADEDKTMAAKAENAPPEKVKGKSNLLLFGGIGLGVVVLGVALALFVLKPMLSGDDSSDEPASTQKQETKKDEHASKPKPKKEGKGEEAVVFAIKDIVVNPAGTAGSRFLSASFGFELGSSQAEQLFQQKEPLVRDVLITILSSKSVAELTDPKQKELMRLQIKTRLGQLLGTDDLTGVYYTDFVLQ